MLILTRRPGESIMIQNNETVNSTDPEDLHKNAASDMPLVTMRVLRVKGNQVSIGFDAPQSVNIFRDEIYRKQNPNSDTIGNTLDSEYTADYTDEDNYY